MITTLPKHMHTRLAGNRLCTRLAHRLRHLSLRLIILVVLTLVTCLLLLLFASSLHHQQRPLASTHSPRTITLTLRDPPRQETDSSGALVDATAVDAADLPPLPPPTPRSLTDDDDLSEPRSALSAFAQRVFRLPPSFSPSTSSKSDSTTITTTTTATSPVDCQSDPFVSNLACVPPWWTTSSTTTATTASTTLATAVDPSALLPPTLVAALPRADTHSDPPSRVEARSQFLTQHVCARFPPSAFPIAVVAHDRPELLNRTLASLLHDVSGLNRSQVTVYQDGTHGGVVAVAHHHGVRLSQNTATAEYFARNPPNVGARIAMHYGWLLTRVFAENPMAAYAIIVEDDMVFSPDFLLYFCQLAPVWEEDSSIYCVSSWNDNGLRGLARDPRVVMRTSFFVGLGWMAKRSIFESEWRASWPYEHWDHWLRSPQQRRNRDCLYPEVSRNFNIGRVGSFCNDGLFLQYFERMVMNEQPAVWLGDVRRLRDKEYTEMVTQHIQRGTVISSLEELDGLVSSGASAESSESRNFVLVYEHSSAAGDAWEKFFAVYFGLWHSVPFIRGQRNGVMLIRWKTYSLTLIASYAPILGSLVLNVTHKITGDDVMQAVLRSPFAPPVHTLFGAPSQDCNVACREQNLTCNQFAMYELNTCERLLQFPECKMCSPRDAFPQTDSPTWMTTFDPATGRMESTRQLCHVGMQPSCRASVRDQVPICACSPVQFGEGWLQPHPSTSPLDADPSASSALAVVAVDV